MTDPQPLPAPAPEKINWRLVGRGVLLMRSPGPVRLRPGGHPLLEAAQLGLLALDGARASAWRPSCSACCRSASATRCCAGRCSSTRRCSGSAPARPFICVFWLIQQKFFNAGGGRPRRDHPSSRLSIYLAGITFDWPLVVVALLLGAMAVGAVYLERVMLVVVGLAVILADRLPSAAPGDQELPDPACTGDSRRSLRTERHLRIPCAGR
ncbi:MAG: hypothetical protein MZV70_05115 [Desulfobacterales bacterium]|nr:hypothetical protein [Desulfobacterales bacterium]